MSSDIGSPAGSPAGGAVDDGALAAVRSTMPGDADVADVADVFGLLADPGRVRLLVALRQGDLCVRDAATAAGLHPSAASHALRLLRAHRVVSVRRVGRLAYYSLADRHVRTLLDVALAPTAHSMPVPEHPGATRR